MSNLALANHQAQATYEAWINPSGVVPTRMRCIDSHLDAGGLSESTLTMLLARSAVGKTWFALWLAIQILEQDIPVLFSSQEMRTNRLVKRLLQLKYQLNSREALDVFGEDWHNRGAISTSYLQDFRQLAIYDQQSPSWVDLQRALNQAQQHFGQTPVLFQDYNALMTRKGYYAESSRIPQLAQEAKEFANNNQLVFVQLVQTGRAAEGDISKRNHGHQPLTMEAAMYGGEQAADVMVGLYRPELDPELRTPRDLCESHDQWLENQVQLDKWRNRLVVQILKNRDGQLNLEGDVVRFDPATGQYTEEDTA